MKPTRIIFVCHGNICRSAMAEFIFTHMVKETGRQAEWLISSAAVSYETDGDDMYTPAKRCLRSHGVPFTSHRAHRISPKEYDAADLIIVMDNSNLHLLERIVGCPPDQNKVRKMMSLVGSTRDVADPWYTGDFEQTYTDVTIACRALLKNDTIKN